MHSDDEETKFFRVPVQQKPVETPKQEPKYGQVRFQDSSINQSVKTSVARSRQQDLSVSHPNNARFDNQRRTTPSRYQVSKENKDSFAKVALLLSLSFMGVCLSLLAFFLLRPEKFEELAQNRTFRVVSLPSLSSKSKDEEKEQEKPTLPELTIPLTTKEKLQSPGNTHHTINNNMRSAKITSKAQLRYLKNHFGIVRVINLALDSTYGQDCAQKEKNPKALCERYWARELGLEYIYQPLTNRGPDDQGWQRIKASMQKGNALIHCTHGADRTGAVIGRFRLEEQDENKDDIYKEALKFGFKSKTFRYPKGKIDPNRYLYSWMLNEE